MNKTVPLADLEQVRDALALAMDDIREHVQVADYNLNGMSLGEFVGKPDPPQLVHQQGIDTSRARLEKCRQAMVKLHQWTSGEEDADNS